MERKETDTVAHFTRTNNLLNHARVVLKKEFIGLDAIIDRVADAVLPWLMFPDLNARPTIINLWGMTGVGKSSLVHRLTQLLGFGDRYFRFDLGEGAHGDRGIRQRLADLFPHHHGRPVVLAFDEFQHARTLGNSEQELDKGFSRTLWEILDSGKFSTNYHSHSQSIVYQLMHNVVNMMAKGVIIEKGIVTSGIEEYKRTGLRNSHLDHEEFEPGASKKDTKAPVQAVSNWYIDEILDVSLGMFLTEHELREHLLTLDGPELVAFLYRIYEKSLTPQEVDCTQALVFIMGNLDEAYPMSQNLNPDISADEFHRQSLEINATHIRRALSRRFRMEQIARLGSCHIIYPAFNSTSYEAIIQKELNAISQKATAYGLRLEITSSVVNLIYREGVIPTQGIRPVLASTQELVGSQVANLVVERLQLGLEDPVVRLEWVDGKLRKSWLVNNELVHLQEEKITLSLDRVRNSRKDDLQAVTAVHEAGHAVLAMALHAQVPEAVYSVTAADDSIGFLYLRQFNGLHSRMNINKHVAMMLGGLVAESIVFGEEYITAGGESDLSRATHMVNTAIQSCGFGGELATFGNPAKMENNALPNRERHHLLALEWLESGRQLASRTLREQMPLLLRIADHLSDHSMLAREQLITLAREFGKGLDPDLMVAENRPTPYRDQLKMLAEGQFQPEKWTNLTTVLSLNRDSPPDYKF